MRGRRRLAVLAAFAALAQVVLGGTVHAKADTINGAGGVVDGGLGYSWPDPLVALCPESDQWSFSGLAAGSVVSAGGAEYTGTMSMWASGTTSCGLAGSEVGTVTSEGVSGVNLLSSTVSCSGTNGSMTRNPDLTIELTLNEYCTVNGAGAVGRVTFNVVGTYTPTSVVASVPPSFTSALVAAGFAAQAVP